MRRRTGAALLALLLLLAACGSVACVGAHLGHCCEGPGCEVCPALLEYARIFQSALPLAILGGAALSGLAASAGPRPLRRPGAPRTLVSDRVKLTD